MTEREKIINDLDVAKLVLSDPLMLTPEMRIRIGQVITRGIIALLKEQEAIPPTVSVDTWICSKCGHTLESQELINDKENPQVLVHELYKYCPQCGQTVKWE